MKAMEIIEKLKTKAVFSVQDIERLAYCNNDYAKQVLSRFSKRGLIKQVRRNLYTTQDDISVIASNIIHPSYISFWYASYSLGYTEQIVNTIQVATTRKSKAIVFDGYTIKFIPIKHFFGFKKVHTDKGDVFIADDEKLLIDAFLRPEECGNFDEITKMFGCARIRKGRLVDYLKRVGSQSVTKRVGFLLEKTKGIDISGSMTLDRNYVNLNPFAGKCKTVNSKWRVRI